MEVAPGILELPLADVRLSALSWGPADGPLVVALHGFPDTAWTWRHLGPHLAERGYRVVAPFTRGYAPSDIPTDRCFQVGALMADAAELHRVLGGDERSVLIGHDWGAITANGLGAHPENPYRAIVALAVPPLESISATQPDVQGFVRMLPGQLRNSWYTLFNQLPVLPERSFDRLVRRLWQDWSPGYDATTDLAHLAESMGNPAHRRAAFGYYRALPRFWTVPERYRDWHSTWSGIPIVPSLQLYGLQDGCLQPELSRRAQSSLPASASSVGVANAGHFLQLEQPDQVNALITEFLPSSG